ncbi:MAG TPA: M56 family metallopeptidase [Bacteroidales bacterium]|nr:M56 family metallopeptidase [Bacteroidales bacterium]
MEILNNIIPEQIQYALGWTLVHSLWQGAIISIVLGLILWFLKNWSARIRYYISFLFMIIFLLSGIGTFRRIYSENTGTLHELPIEWKTFNNMQSGIGTGILKPDRSPEINALTSFRTKMVDYLNRYYYLISGLWVLGIIILGMRLTGGFFYSNKLKRSLLFEVPPGLIRILNETKEKLGIRKAVKIFESKLAKVPVVVGYFKPVILVPVGILSGIPGDQVETILAHELEHIRRNDFLINIFQSIVEILFFYHPGLWWISSQLRKERENCCDDIALSVSKESITYARALLSMHEIVIGTPSPAVAFNGNKNLLLNRIKRITKMSRSKFSSTDRWMAVVLMIILVSGLSIVTGIASDNSERAGNFTSEELITNIEDVVIEAYSAPSVNFPAQDTIRAKITGTIHTSFNDPDDQTEKDVQMKFENGDLIWLKIDGEEIPESEYHKYQDLVDDTMADLEEAQKEIEEARLEMENIDFEELNRELEEARLEMENIDFEELRMEMEAVRDEMGIIDFDNVRIELEESMTDIEAFDIEEMRMQVEKALIDMKEIDMEEFKLEIEESIKKVKIIDSEEFKKEIEEVKKIIKESLKEIEELRIEEPEKIGAEKEKEKPAKKIVGRSGNI